MTTTIALGRELQISREVVRFTYEVAREIERSDLLKKLKKLKKRNRKLEAGFQVLVGLANEARLLEFTRYRMELEALHVDHEKGG